MMRMVDTTSDGLPVLEWKRRAISAEVEAERLRCELRADLFLWESSLGQIDESSPIHAILSLRVAAIRGTLGE